MTRSNICLDIKKEKDLEWPTIIKNAHSFLVHHEEKGDCLMIRGDEEFFFIQTDGNITWTKNEEWVKDNYTLLAINPEVDMKAFLTRRLGGE